MREKLSALFLAVTFVFTMLFSVLSAVQFHVAGVWGEPDVDSLERYLRASHSPLVLWNLFLVSSCFLVPISRRYATSIVVVLAHANFSVLLRNAMDEGAYCLMNTLVSESRVVVAALIGNTPLVVVINVVLWVFHGAHVHSSDGQHNEARLLVMCTLAALMHDLQLRSAARATVQAMSSSRSEATTHKLLQAMCETVVHLDDDLMVTGSPSQLDALLFRRVPPTEQTHFPSVLNCEDRGRFEAWVSGRTSEVSLHVTMLDQANATVRAELFHESFEVFGVRGHIIGIREHDDPQDKAMALGRDAMIESPSTSMEDHVFTSHHRGRLSVWLDATSNVLRIVDCSASLTAFSGPLRENEDLISWVVTAKAEFLEWVQLSTSDVGAAPTTMLVHFAPHGSPKCQFRARCVVFGTGNFCCLELYDVRYPSRSSAASPATVERGTSARAPHSVMSL